LMRILHLKKLSLSKKYSRISWPIFII